MYRLLQRMWMWRWSRSVFMGVLGVRLHPSAILIGALSRFRLGRGTKIGARSILDIERSGELFLAESVWLSTDVEVQTSTKIQIGSGTTIQRRCSVNGTVRIGDWCIFAPNVFVSSGTHPFREFPALTIREQERLISTSASGVQKSFDNPVWIQTDSWLGANVVVCPGVTIGRGSVVGANSVVTRDVMPYSIVAGCPARLIGKRLEWLPPACIDATIEEHAIFVLDGMRVKDSEGAFGFSAANAQGYFVAALAKLRHYNCVRIRYRSVPNSKIRVAGIEYLLPEADGTIDLPWTGCEELEFVRFELEILFPRTLLGFFISRLDILPGDVTRSTGELEPV